MLRRPFQGHLKEKKIAILLIIRFYSSWQSTCKRAGATIFTFKAPPDVTQLTSVLGLLRIQDNWRYPHIMGGR